MRKRAGKFGSGIVRWLCLLCVAALLGSVAAPPPAIAQDSLTLFERLFAPKKRPKPVIRENRAKPRPARTSRPSASREPAPERVDKLDNARRVLVIGDFMSGGLAEGLTAAFAESPGVRIDQRSNGSSGLVRDDYYDWLGELPSILDEAEAKPTVVVIMIGANDRQEIRTTSPRLSLRSEGWNKEYEARANKLAKLIVDRGIPFIWVGQPPFRSSRMSSDMVAFNDVYRRAAEANSGEFVDIWDGFVSESGAYITTGPDMNGQPARLRAGDGINITRAGRRKIAFYVEKPLRKLLGDAASPDIGMLGPENLPSISLDPLAVPKFDRTTPISLDDPDLDGGSELLGATVEISDGESATLGEQLTIEGKAPPPKPGRADDFRQNPTVEKPVEKTPPALTGSGPAPNL